MGNDPKQQPKPPQVPTIGRIVLFRKEFGAIAPAIVVGVHVEKIDLQVFSKDADGSRLITDVAHDPRAEVPQTWHWPPQN